jgi:hypothetical protein
VSAVTSGVAQASAWNALFGITRAALSEAAEDPERCACPVQLAGSCSYSTHGTHSTFAGRFASSPSSCPRADDAERSSGASLAASRIVSSPCSGISLPTKSACVKAPGGPGSKDALLGPDEAHLDSLEVGELREEASVLLRVGDDDVGRASARRSTNESARAASEPGRKRARSETSVSVARRAG